MTTRVLPLHPSPADVTRTHCPYCAFQCGMTMAIRTSAELSPRVQVKADPDFPVNRGQMCIKGFNSAALLDHPQRVLEPLMRNRAGMLQPATWDAALSYVAERLLDIKHRYGADANGAFGSGALTNEKAYLLGKFVRVALGSSQIDYNGRYCMASAAAGQNRAYGIDRGLPFPVSDIAETKALMLWGSNCAETMPPIMQWLERQREQGGMLIVVDPRRTETARAAHLHLPLTPGSDLALGNGLLALAIEMRLIDPEYIAQRTLGFDAVRRGLSSYEPARIERMTGISLPTLREAVRLLATSESSMILSGRGPEQQSKGSDTVLTFTNLMLALGKVGKPFSGYGCLTGQGNGQGGREHGQKADQLPGYRSIVDPTAREHVARVWGVSLDSLPTEGTSAYEMLDGIGNPAGLRSLLVFGSNLVVASPHASRVREKLAGLELLVVCDSFVNETAELAHVVLPIKQWAEEEGSVTNLEGRVIRRRKAMDGPRGLLSDTDIMYELAQRLGYGAHFSYPDSESIFNELRLASAGGKADYSGITYQRLDEEQGVFWPCPSEGHPGTPRLFTQHFFFPDGRARFHMVHHRPAGEEPDAEYPLYFTTGRYKEHYNSGAQTRRVDKLNDAKPEPRLQMHPRLARHLEVDDDDLVQVESRRGKVTFRVSVNGEIRSDTLFAPFHWGGRAAANILTNPALDPKSRMPEFKVCAVRATVEKQS